MKNSLLLFLLSFAFASTYAQSFAPVKDEAAVRKKFAEVSQATKSIRSDFTQEKNLSMLAEKVESRGVFYFKKPNMVRLEYTKPFKYLLIMSNGKATIKDDAKTTQMDMHKTKIFQQVNGLIVDCVQGSALNNSNFQVKISESTTQLRMDMKPLAKGLKEFFSDIIIFIDKTDYSVNKMQMNELSGDNTVITFSNKKINGDIPDAVFTAAH
ncbi:MAG: outer membrane lipoprotein carrier protein LolA [Bacteroidetes bacterium]|nr:outer membrane lipoprotein carrier protein LolA [Bacteroidota bacterium]